MTSRATDERPSYTEPEIRTLHDDELIEAVGPAQAYSGNFPFSF